VVDRCTCGAQPPDDARFCHKCGRPLYDYVLAGVEAAPPPLPVAAAPVPELPQVSFRNGAAVRIGLLTAVLTVVVSAIPLPLVLGLVRVPILPLGAGAFAVWRWMQRTRQRPSIQDGARLGWITGIFTFLILSGFLTILLLAASSPDVMAQLRQMVRPDASTKQLLDFLQNPAPAELIASLAAMFVFFTALTALGGAVWARFLRRQRHQEGV